MKKSLFAGLTVLLLAFLIVSCGVPQEEYDQLESDAGAAIAERDAEIQALSDELETAGDECYARIDSAYQYLAITAELYPPSFSGDGLDASLAATVGDMVMAIGDTQLQQLYDAWAASPTDADLAYALLTYAFEQVDNKLSE